MSDQREAVRQMVHEALNGRCHFSILTPHYVNDPPETRRKVLRERGKGRKVDAEGRPVERTEDDGSLGILVGAAGGVRRVVLTPEEVELPLDEVRGLVESRVVEALQILSAHAGQPET